jgi:mannose-1-phosphate guanylyltransferase
MSSPLDRLFVFIMAGGSGERFWPVSRTATPKHLVRLLGEQTLLEQTVRRFVGDGETEQAGLVPADRIFVLTNAAQLEACLRELPFLPAENIIAEPAKRDTAPAAALATAIARSRREDAVVALFPADAMIHDTGTFRDQVREAAAHVAAHPSILTFSITPTFPSTGFGYLELEEGATTKTGAVTVNRFVEKPDEEKARGFLEGKRHGWNAGMFLWQAGTFLAECEKHQPDLENFILHFPKGDHTAYLAERFPELPKISVDYAIMEHAASVVALIARFDWDDVGSWTALPSHLGQDEHGNTTKGPVVLLNAGRNIVVTGKRTVALCGVSDLVVVETEDAILVCHRDSVQKIKNLPLPSELK